MGQIEDFRLRVCATTSASLRSLTVKMGQSGSFALPLAAEIIGPKVVREENAGGRRAVAALWHAAEAEGPALQDDVARETGQIIFQWSMGIGKTGRMSVPLWAEYAKLAKYAKYAKYAKHAKLASSRRRGGLKVRFNELNS